MGRAFGGQWVWIFSDMASFSCSFLVWVVDIFVWRLRKIILRKVLLVTLFLLLLKSLRFPSQWALLEENNLFLNAQLKVYHNSWHDGVFEAVTAAIFLLWVRYMEASPFFRETFSSVVIIVCACQCQVCLNYTELFLVIHLIRSLFMLVFKAHETFESCTGLFFPCLWQNSVLFFCCGHLNLL